MFEDGRRRRGLRQHDERRGGVVVGLVVVFVFLVMVFVVMVVFFIMQVSILLLLCYNISFSNALNSLTVILDSSF